AKIAENAAALVHDDAVLGAALVRDRKAKTAVAIVVAAKPLVGLKQTAQAPVNGVFVVDGAIKSGGNYETIYAYITKGAFASNECTRDSTTALPAFRFTCP